MSKSLKIFLAILICCEVGSASLHADNPIVDEILPRLQSLESKLTEVQAEQKKILEKQNQLYELMESIKLWVRRY